MKNRLLLLGIFLVSVICFISCSNSNSQYNNDVLADCYDEIDTCQADDETDYDSDYDSGYDESESYYEDYVTEGDYVDEEVYAEEPEYNDEDEIYNGPTYELSLPYTYTIPMGNIGYQETTINEDGTMTTRMVTQCRCQGGLCDICCGTKTRYWSGIGLLPCSNCGGTGFCPNCTGKGYQVMNTRTEYGRTIGIDEQGHIYLCDESTMADRGNDETRNVYLSTSEMAYCRKCGKKDLRHIHVHSRNSGAINIR